MANQLNSGSLDTLKVGQTLLTKVTKTSTNKVQIELAERIQNTNSPSSLGDGFTNALGMLNASDGAFSAGKPRRHWAAVEPIDLEMMLNIDGLDLETGDYQIETVQTANGPKQVEVMYLNILNPQVDVDPTTGEVMSPERLRIRIVETVEGNEWDMAHPETKAKRRGKGGDYILHNGNYIFNKNQVLFSKDLSTTVKIPHVFLAGDATSVTKRVEDVVTNVVEDVEYSEDINE
tara:strand:- start:1445 stop:2143 length:699 start_codon:yes stop_codon:yes gene_type:complete